jgi:hypothetical protein
MPQIDDAKTANARKIALGCGSTRLGRVYAEDGLDFEDEVTAMAQEYGVTVDEMRVKLLDANFGAKEEASPEVPDEEKEEETEERTARASGSNGKGRLEMIRG